MCFLLQYGIIYAIKILLKHFTLTDFANVWFEFNFMEIFTKFSQYNYSTALDLTCQSDLIDVSSKLIVGKSVFTYAYVPFIRMLSFCSHL